MTFLAEAIEWKYGNEAGAKCDLDKGIIEEWNHPAEPMPDVFALLAEYEPIRQQKEQDRENIKNDASIADLMSKRPVEAESHIRSLNSVPELREVVLTLVKLHLNP